MRDDQLRLIFTCCHPSLATEAQVALTLRALCGLLRRLGRNREAAAAYREAVALATNAVERRFLERRLAEIHGRSPSRDGDAAT